MRFLVRKRRSTPAVIIVALIDVLIVLVIFLLVTTTFKQQAMLRLKLPESTEAKTEGATDNQSITVSIDDKGILMLGQDRLPVTLEQLQNRLRQDIAKNPQLKLAIRADKAAPWGKIVNVMDAAKEAQIKSVSASVNNKPMKP